MVIESWQTNFSLFEMVLALTMLFGATTIFLLIIGSMAIIDRMTKFFHATLICF
jgi:hypothetical protein